MTPAQSGVGGVSAATRIVVAPPIAAIASMTRERERRPDCRGGVVDLFIIPFIAVHVTVPAQCNTHDAQFMTASRASKSPMVRSTLHYSISGSGCRDATALNTALLEKSV